MSELINNSMERKRKLKDLILRLHHGESELTVRTQLLNSLAQIPYNEVVEVEQELIAEGLPTEEILDLCDSHSAVLNGHINLQQAQVAPLGHPVDTFIKENQELRKVVEQIKSILSGIPNDQEPMEETLLLKLNLQFNLLFDVDKHYLRKEYLLFPFLEKRGITGPPKVMWGKHDQIREQIKGCIELSKVRNISNADFIAAAEISIAPTLVSVVDMTTKEEEILLPMSMDNLNEIEWYEVEQQSLDFGFCLYDPPVKWAPQQPQQSEDQSSTNGAIKLPSGSFSTEEITALLNTLPLDITFVDKHDKVKYFSQGSERIFQRNRAILNRDVRLCHPPGSTHIVEKILEDFKSRKANRAPFWINKGGTVVHIEYFALRNEQGDYLGTLEVSHNVTRYRELEGEQRILSYTQ